MLRPFAHPVTCCWLLLRVVTQSLKPVKLFSQQLPTFLLFRDRRSVAQQCWIRLHSSSNIVGPRIFYKDLWVVSFPQCTAGPYIARSYWIRLQTTANTHATTSKNVGSCCVRLHAALLSLPLAGGSREGKRFKDGAH